VSSARFLAARSALTLLLRPSRFDAKNITPRYEFGFGLSYTTFSYSSLGVKSTDLKRRNNGGSSVHSLGLYDDAYTVSFDVKNSGGVDGYEVSQVYLVSPLLHPFNGRREHPIDHLSFRRASPNRPESLRRC
jgi:hypothetical protein